MPPCIMKKEKKGKKSRTMYSSLSYKQCSVISGFCGTCIYEVVSFIMSPGG